MDDDAAIGCGCGGCLGLLSGFIIAILLPISTLSQVKNFFAGTSGTSISSSKKPYWDNTRQQPDIKREPDILDVSFDRNTVIKEIRDILVSADNCGGTGEISQKYEVSEKLRHDYSLEKTATLNFPITILTVELQRSVSFELEKSRTKKITTDLKTAPNSNVEYTVTTREIWQKGVIHTEVDSKQVDIPFHVRSDVDAVVTSSKLLPCL